MRSAKRSYPARGLPWRLIYCSIAVATIAGMCARTVKAQSFILYDPDISGAPQTVTSAVLSDLLVPTSYIIADGAEFNNFLFSPAAFGNGVNTPSAAEILITAPTSANPELFFQGGPFLATDLFNNEFVDASLQFDVTELNTMQKITAAELKYTGATFGTGTTSISEVVDDMQNNLLGQRAYVEENGGGVNAGTITFAGQQEIQVSKDIMLVADNTENSPMPDDSATLSDFSQTFNVTPTVPEPSSIVMAVLGSGGLGWFGWRRRAKRRSSVGNVSTELVR